MEYKRQTREVQYKGRNVHNPAKQLAQENKAYKARDAGMMAEWNKRGKEYNIALEEWNANLAGLDKEVVDFWKTVTPAATQLLSKTIPDLMQIKAEKDDENAIQTFRDLSLEEQQTIRDQARYLFKESDGIYDRRADLEAEAKRLGLTEYAQLLNGLNKRGDTRIYRELISGELNNYEQELKNALASTDKKYEQTIYDNNGKVIDVIKFSGADIGNDLTKLEIVLKAEEADFYKRVQVGGINTKIITAFADETLQEVGQRVARTEGNRISIADAKAETQKIISSIATDLNMSLGWTDEDGYGFKLTEDGEIAPEVVQNFSTILKRLKEKSILAGESDPVNKAADRFAAGLLAWANDQNDPEKARSFVNELLGSHGETENTIKLTNGATFATLDRIRFGATGSWANSTSQGGDVSDGVATSKDRLDNSGIWWPVDDNNNKRSEEWLKENPLVSADGTLNTKWQGTWQYKLVEASRNPEVNLEDIKEEAIAEMRKKGIFDVQTHAQVLNWTPPKSFQATKNFIQNNRSDLVVGNEIARSDLAGYDLGPQTIEWLKKEGITIVDNTIGALDNGRLDAETIILEKLKLTPGGFTAGKEAILDDVMAKAIEIVKLNPERTPQNENELLLTAVNGLLSNEMVAAQEDRSHPWYLNEDGEAVNQFRHGWVPFSSVPAERLKQKLEAETRLNTYLLRNVKDGSPASTQVNFWSTKDLTGIVDKYNTTGTLDFSVLNTTAIANEDPITAINNQIDKLGLDIPHIVPSAEYQAFLTAFDNGDIQTIYKLNGDKGSNTPSITTARIIDEKVNNLLRDRSNGFLNLGNTGQHLPSQQGLLATAKESFGGELSTNRDGRLGIYGIPIEEAKRLVPGFKLETFLSDANMQKKAMARLIDEETSRQFQLYKDAYRGDLFNEQDYTGFSVIVRNVLHRMSTGQSIDNLDTIKNYRFRDDNQIYSSRRDEVGADQFNQNTNMLMIYLDNNRGGFVPSRSNPNYYNRFGF